MSLLFGKQHKRRWMILWSILSVIIVIMLLALSLASLFTN
jgi:predicted nucleic acid-binding Zn ribbon protein